MVKRFFLGRDVRLKSEIVLPGGDVVKVDTNVSADRLALNRAFNETLKPATVYAKDPTPENTEAFYRKYAEFVRLILGDKAYSKALKAYDGDTVELCRQLDRWIAAAFVPKLQEASRQELENRKKIFKIGK